MKETDSRSTNGKLPKEVVKSWIVELLHENETYEYHIGRALEARDETAVEFLNIAYEIDPEFIRCRYENFLYLVEVRQQKKQVA